MARGTTLTNLVAMLKAELGDSSNANTARDAELYVLLSNKQKVLATELFGGPYIYHNWDCPMTINGQFYSLPTSMVNPTIAGTVNMDLDRLPHVEVLFNNVYLPVMYGIDERQLSIFNYQLTGAVSTPVQRWRLATNPNETTLANQFEVWPVPSTVQTLRFTAQRELQALATGTDKADLDDMLLVLFVAADLAARRKLPDAALKLQQANRRLQWLRQGYNKKDVRRTMDGHGDAEWERHVRLVGIRVAVH